MVTIGILFAIGAFISLAMSNFFQKKSVAINGVSKNIYWNQALGAVLLTGLFFVFAPPVDVPALAWVYIIVTTIVALTGMAFFLQGLKVGSLSVVTPISATGPLVTAALAVLFLGEVITILQAIAIVVVVAGSALVGIQKSGGRFKLSDPGVLYGLGAAFMWGITFIFFSLAINMIGWLLPTVLGRYFGIAFFGILFLVLKKPLKVSRVGFTQVGLATIFEVTGFSLAAVALSFTLASLATPVINAHPVVSVLLGALFLGERLRLYQYGAIITIIIGLGVLSL